MNDVLIWILILMILLHGRVWSLRSYLVQSSPRRQQLSSSSSCPSPGKQQPYSPVRSKNVEDDHELNLGLGQEKVLYVDDDVIVVDKPSRAQSAPGFLCQDSLATRLASTFRINRVDKMIVHRLDYATSGVIVYARNEWSLSHLHAQFRATGKVKKSYLAIVDGNIPNDEGEVDLPLGKDSQRGSPFCCVDLVDGKKSKTFWQVKQRSATATLVQLFPLTGRTHQLRIHMAALGHPILGDYFYAPPVTFERADRLLLHAENLSFTHPRSSKRVEFTATCPFSLSDYP